MVIPKYFNDMALRRTSSILKDGIGFDRSVRDMLAHAYTCGFIDCFEVSRCDNDAPKARTRKEKPVAMEDSSDISSFYEIDIRRHKGDRGCAKQTMKVYPYTNRVEFYVDYSISGDCGKKRFQGFEESTRFYISIVRQ